MPRRLVPSGRTGGSAFFDSVLFGQTLANLQGVLLDGRHPFLCLVNLVFLLLDGWHPFLCLVNLVFQVIRFFQ